MNSKNSISFIVYLEACYDRTVRRNERVLQQRAEIYSSVHLG